jgi:hypothetical protein
VTGINWGGSAWLGRLVWPAVAIAVAFVAWIIFDAYRQTQTPEALLRHCVAEKVKQAADPRLGRIVPIIPDPDYIPWDTDQYRYDYATQLCTHSLNGNSGEFIFRRNFPN